MIMILCTLSIEPTTVSNIHQEQNHHHAAEQSKGFKHEDSRVWSLTDLESVDGFI